MANQLEKIQNELQVEGDIPRVILNPEDKVDRMLVVDDDEIKVERVLTEEEEKEMEKQRLEKFV